MWMMWRRAEAAIIRSAFQGLPAGSGGVNLRLAWSFSSLGLGGATLKVLPKFKKAVGVCGARSEGMNKKQRIVFLAGTGIIVLMGLIPPWYFHRTGDYPDSPGYYGFIFATPYEIGNAIDVTRLFIQWAVVAIATAAIMWVLKDLKR
jgi:hypothetical protein